MVKVEMSYKSYLRLTNPGLPEGEYQRLAFEHDQSVHAQENANLRAEFSGASNHRKEEIAKALNMVIISDTLIYDL